jgi:hypothetical protein
MKEGMAVFLIAALSVVLAGEAGSADDRWSVEISPYFWGVSTKGRVSIDGIPYPKPASFLGALQNDFDNLRDDFDANATGSVIVRTGNWLAMADFARLDVSNTIQFPMGTVSTEVESILAMLAVGYRYRQESLYAPTFDLFIGGRYNRHDVDIEMTPITDTSRTEEWVDPLFGATFSIYITKWLSFSVMANIGGFEVGSDLARETVTLFGIDLGPRVSLKGGYRWLDIEYGDEDDDFFYDVTTQGWLAGFSVRL